MTCQYGVFRRHGGLFTAVQRLRLHMRPRTCTRGREPLAPDSVQNPDDTDSSQENIIMSLCHAFTHITGLVLSKPGTKKLCGVQELCTAFASFSCIRPNAA